MRGAFEQFLEWYAAYGYPVLFLGVLLESAGVPVPGETAVLVASFLASPAGGEHFHLGWVIVLTGAAAILGDNLGYWLGRRLARPRLRGGRGFLFLTPQRFQKVEDYFARYGAWTVFGARFVAGLRVAAAPAAGAAGMHWPRFLAANAAGGLAWAVTVSLLGYFFGRSWELLHHWLHWGAWAIPAAVLLALGLRYLWRVRSRHSEPRGPAGQQEEIGQR
jgi:membrane protein DedA with SNARE-associated domain